MTRWQRQPYPPARAVRTARPRTVAARERRRAASRAWSCCWHLSGKGRLPEVDLPLIPITQDLAIALLITVDHGVRFVARAGAELADRLAPYELDLVVSVATMGIPLAIEVTRALGLDDYLILQKTPKLHLRDAISEPVTIDHDRHSAAAALRCRQGRRGEGQASRARRRRDLHGRLDARCAGPAQRVGAEPVAIGTLVTEASTWRRELGDDGRSRARPRCYPGVPSGQLRGVRRGLGRGRRARRPGDLPRDRRRPTSQGVATRTSGNPRQ